MLELLALFAVLGLGLALLAFLALAGFLLKVVFKVALFPLWLLWTLVKGVLLILLLVAGLVFAPVLFGVLLLLAVLALPLLLLAGVIGVGWALAAG